MANRLKMAEHQSILALARLGWSYRRIAAEVGVDRETVSRHVRAARGDPPVSNASISITGSAAVSGIGTGVPDAATVDSADPNAAISITGFDGSLPTQAGRRSRCEPLRAVILAKLEQGLTAQRIWQDLTGDHHFTDSYQSVQRFVRTLRSATPLPFRRMEREPGAEAQIDFGRGAPILTPADPNQPGGNPRRISMLQRRLERLASKCRFTNLTKIKPDAFEAWLVEQADNGMSASARNCYRESAIGFCNWARRSKRLTTNPLADVARADANVDRRHHRRALTELELQRLLKAAALRPLAEYGREVVANEKSLDAGPNSRATWNRAALKFEDLDAAVSRARSALADNPAFMKKLNREGSERALIYRVLFQTGLRRGELAALTVADLDFTRSVAYIILEAKHEKNRKGSEIPLRTDLALALKEWLAERLEQAQTRCRSAGAPMPSRLPGKTPLLNVPAGLNRIFDRDLAAAGINKRDERNRVVDVHALRVSFGSHLCAAGIPLRTAQAAMRHSKPELTARVYVDVKLLDVAGALESLPSLATAPFRTAQ